MEQRAARERVHLLERGRRFARLQTLDRMEEKAIRAVGVVLQGRWRIGLRTKPELFQRGQRFGFGLD